MNPYQRVLAFVCSICAVVLICGIPGHLMYYLDTVLEWERTDGIFETGPVGNPFLGIVFILIIFMPLIVGLVYCLTRLAIFYFERYLDAEDDKK
ncbi:hypothetical protein V144x_37580 [Gimesia aquarii]|uniref:Uncharacterized protein n=1 Tax=Gimesia aquarii TaxID=2527964 RepID=A0A517VZ45_9PLAN|nr:hypothetical protein V144x_37580 [Gimesia aquarii]